MAKSKIGIIDDEGEYWKLTLANPNKKHTISKVISNQKKQDVLTKVDLDLVKDKDGKQELKSSISEVYYPKYKYRLEDIEAASQDIVKVSKDAECPVCEKMHAALSINEIETPFEKIFGLPPIEDVTAVLPAMSDLLSPFEGITDVIDDMLKSSLASVSPPSDK